MWEPLGADERRTHMRATGSVLALTIVLATCGGGSGADPTSTTSVAATTATQPPTTTTTPPSGVISVGDLDVIVPPDADGNYPPDLLVSCDSGQFPVSALQEIRPLEEADPEIAEAISPFLTNEEGRFWPQEGWQVVHETSNEIQLVAKTTEGTLAFMTVTNDGSDWAWSGGSIAGDPCQLRFTVPEELNTVEWSLDPEAAKPTAETTEIAVILQERECVSGQKIGDRLVGPQIVMTETRVFMAFASQRPQGDAFDCQGNPETPFTVVLPEPIGDRELVEGLEIGIDLADYVD